MLLCMSDRNHAIGVGVAGVVGLLAVGGRAADDLVRVGAQTARIADNAVVAGRVGGIADEVTLARSVADDLVPQRVLDGIDAGGIALDVSELMLELDVEENDALSLSTVTPPSGIWQSHRAPASLPLLWSCDPGAESLCAVSFEEPDTLSLRMGMGSLFYAELGEVELLCRRIHSVSAPLPNRTMDETLSYLNADACHVITEQKPEKMKLRAADGHEYVLIQRS